MLRWAALLAGTALAAVTLGLLGLPSPTLFGALAAGLVSALVVSRHGRRPLLLPRWAVTAGQAGIGVLAGLLLRPQTLASLADDWLPVALAVLVTLLISLAAGLVLGTHRDVDTVTGSFAMVAGGASGLTAMSRDLGADDRIVAVVQYLRVLVIIAAMPVVALAVPGPGPAGPGGDTGPGGPAAVLGTVPDWLVVLACAAVGLALARTVPLPSGTLLLPMALAAAASGSGLVDGAQVPPPLLQISYAAIGLSVGLGFTPQSLVTLRRILPLALALIVALIAATAAAGIPLLALSGASVLDGYLATTPGGLFAVVATAAETGADTTLVLTVQVVRLLVMLLLAPAIAVALGRRGRARSSATPTADGGRGDGDREHGTEPPR